MGHKGYIFFINILIHFKLSFFSLKKIISKKLLHKLHSVYLDHVIQ
jgi:hypothetical protein